MSQTAKYRVTTGIFENMQFVGYPHNGRIINANSVGQSFPAENCEIIPHSTAALEFDALTKCADVARDSHKK